MPWTPPTPPPNTRTDSTPLPTNHATDHNTISNALTTIINELGSDPKGDFANLTARLAGLIPPGVVNAYVGETAPTGWALCDGTALSRATYASLFAVIGVQYGGGDGSTTFNLPDLRSRFVAGKGTAAWSDSRAEAGGSKDAVAVAHTHDHPDHGHSNTFSASSSQGTHAHVEGAEGGLPTGWLYSGGYDGSHYDVFTGSGLSGARSTYSYAQPSTAAASAGAITTSISGGVSNGNAGTTNSQSPTASGTDANLPPYITLNYIIRLG